MKRLFVSVFAAAALLASVAVAASADSGRVLANPANACRELIEWNVGGYESFGDCKGRIHQDVADFRFFDDEAGGLIGLSERCTAFENQFLTYPFYFDEGPEWPFTTFTAQNHQQCMVTLYTYHTLASLFGE
jgi:hypothetical protein